MILDDKNTGLRIGRILLLKPEGAKRVLTITYAERLKNLKHSA